MLLLARVHLWHACKPIRTPQLAAAWPEQPGGRLTGQHTKSGGCVRCGPFRLGWP